jgi:hypothetical protein
LDTPVLLNLLLLGCFSCPNDRYRSTGYSRSRLAQEASFNFMSCSVLDKDIGGNKEGGTAHSESVAELASDLPPPQCAEDC